MTAPDQVGPPTARLSIRDSFALAITAVTYEQLFGVQRQDFAHRLAVVDRSHWQHPLRLAVSG
jgi:hypothetical protein